MTAPLIIHDEPNRADQQEVVAMLADFSFTPSEQIFENLKKSGSMAGMAKQGSCLRWRHEGGDPGQPTPDLNDVKYDAFLANDRTLADPEIVKVEPGGRVLLRIINGSAMSAFHVGLGALEGELIAVDGFEVEPIRGRDVSGRGRAAARYPREPSAGPRRLSGARAGRGRAQPDGNHPGRRRRSGRPHSRTQRKRRRPRSLSISNGRCAPKSRLAPRKADRVHILNLTGEMAGYVWSINNVVWNKDTPPLAVAEGERVELVFVNQTPMPHPMHLHGHEFQVVEIDGERFPGAVRDTILVTPGRRVVVAFDANNPGWWALHCHLLYHLEAGMFTTIKYV